MAADGGRGNWSHPVTSAPNPYQGGELWKARQNPGWTAYANANAQNGRPLVATAQNLAAWGAGQGYNTYAGMSTPTPTNPFRPTSFGGGGGGGRGGGGGGGGGGGMTQAQLDWAAQLLSKKPQQQTFTDYVAPEWQSFTPAAFDPTMWNTARTKLGEAVAGDRATATQATANMADFMARNQSDPFAALAPAQAQGMDQQAMLSLMAGQGVNPNTNAGVQGAQQGAAAANAGFSSLAQALSGIEQRNQANQRVANQQYGQDAQNRINAANLGLGAGIDMSQAQGKNAYDQNVQQMAYQDWLARQQLAQSVAQGNWQGRQQIGQANTTAGNEWLNQQIQSYLSLIGQLPPGLTLPDLAGLGLGG